MDWFWPLITLNWVCLGAGAAMLFAHRYAQALAFFGLGVFISLFMLTERFYG